MCLYWRLLMNNSSFYLFIYFDDSWSCEPLSLKHQWFRRNMCSILWKTAREVLFFCCCGFRWCNRWYSEWRVHSLVWRCHIWKTNGSGKKPLALFVLMLCVNIPPRRLKMKFVLLFGLWSVVQCWEISLTATANECCSHVEWIWNHQKLRLGPACQFLVFSLLL